MSDKVRIDNYGTDNPPDAAKFGVGRGPVRAVLKNLAPARSRPTAMPETWGWTVFRLVQLRDRAAWRYSPRSAAPHRA